MKRRAQQPQTPGLRARPVAQDGDTERLARLRRDLALTPAQRLDKFAALSRQVNLLRSARRLP